MSRIIVKNIPDFLTDAKLQSHFASHPSNPVITDVHVIRSRISGRSRRFGFVGFRNVQDAQDAVMYWHGTYIGVDQIEVMLAQAFGSDGLETSAEKKQERQKRRFYGG